MSDDGLYDFIALYNHEDAHLVKDICDALMRYGVTSWFAADKIEGGDVWQDRLTLVLPRTRAVVIFFGPHGPDGKQMDEEWPGSVPVL
jgi:hypothetical protein